MTSARRAEASNWGGDPSVLHIARWTDECRVLGPGLRAVVWVQGCPFRCRGCVVPETLPFAGGEVKTTAEVIEFLAAAPNIEGVTFSGGEPFAQAGALVTVLDGLAARRPGLSAMSYSGYTLDWLTRSGTPAQQQLVERLDVIVDGPYIPERHTDLRWRGSDNQTVHILTERYRHIVPSLADRGTWLEIDVDDDGSLGWNGIPPIGFRGEFETALAASGIDLHLTSDDARS